MKHRQPTQISPLYTRNSVEGLKKHMHLSIPDLDDSGYLVSDDSSVSPLRLPMTRETLLSEGFYFYFGSSAWVSARSTQLRFLDSQAWGQALGTGLSYVG